jgi:hypothetical protein
MRAILLKVYKVTFPFVALWIVYAFMHSNEFSWHFWAGMIAYIFVGFEVVGVIDNVDFNENDLSHRLNNSIMYSDIPGNLNYYNLCDN